MSTKDPNDGYSDKVREDLDRQFVDRVLGCTMWIGGPIGIALSPTAPEIGGLLCMAAVFSIVAIIARGH